MNATLSYWQKRLGLVLFCYYLSLTNLSAQMRIGQPAAAPDPSAALDLSGGPYANGSAYRGIAPPKVTLSQTSLATPVTAPTTGLLVYNTAKAADVTPGYYYWEGSRWVRLNTTTGGLDADNKAIKVVKSTGDVLINATTDVPSSKVTINSTTQGVLFPRMTMTQRNAISAPAEGLTIYNMTDHALEFYNGTIWKTVTTKE